jgi:hypothetical protein
VDPFQFHAGTRRGSLNDADRKTRWLPIVGDSDVGVEFGEPHAQFGRLPRATARRHEYGYGHDEFSPAGTGRPIGALHLERDPTL